MSHLRPNSVPLKTTTKQIDLAFMRPLQKQYLHDNLFASINASNLSNDNRITILPASTNAGKTTVICKITIPCIIHMDSSARTIVFTSPDSGCVDGPYNKFYSEWHGNRIRCVDGKIKTIRVRRKDEIKKSWALNEQTSDDIVDVWFVSTQWLGHIWGQYRDPRLTKGIGVPQYVFVDEIHFGMGTIDATTIFADQGRKNKNFDPKWLPTIVGMAKAGARIIGYTGTATLSQQGGTTLGAKTFKTLAAMPEHKNTSVFANEFPIKSKLSTEYYAVELANTYSLSKSNYELMVNECNQFFNEIEADTWNKAMDIGIVKVIPGAFFKFGRYGGAKSLPLNRIQNDLAKFVSSLKSHIGIVTCKIKTYSTKGFSIFGTQCKDAYSVIELANDKRNQTHPLLLNVINQGNMGWDIPRLKQISFLGYPSAQNVFLMQLQTMARAKRLMCDVYDHTDKAREIAELDVSTEQKILLAKYVVFMNTVNIVIPRYAHLLDNAYTQFRQNMYTPDEGLDLYLNIIKTHVPVTKKNNVTTMTKPHFHMGYNPGSQNQANKKDYCQHCTDLGLVNDNGVSLCKVLGSVLADDLANNLAGVKLTNQEFEQHWQGQLKLDHLNGVRTDNRPENLYTRCGISDALKTLIQKDYLNTYKIA
jgi:hypothetical protein